MRILQIVLFGVFCFGINANLIHDFIDSGSSNAETFKKLLAAASKQELSEFNSDGYSPLHLAIVRGNYMAVQVLLDNQLDPNQTTARGVHPMQLAVTSANENFGAIHLLAAAGSDLEVLYQNTFSFVEQQAKPPVCLLCLKPYRLIGSHFIPNAILSRISGAWKHPGRPHSGLLSSDKMTLPLFCKGAGTSGCEDLFSDLGENDFPARFMDKWYEEVLQSIQQPSLAISDLRYGQWLFHLVVSTAFRAMLVSPVDHEMNWPTRLRAAKNLDANITARTWNFFLELRDFLVNGSKSRPRVRMFLSQAGMLGKEPPLVTHVVTYQAADGLRPAFLFGFHGCYFWITSGSDPSVLDNPGRFAADVALQSGVIQVPAGSIFELPKTISSLLENIVSHVRILAGQTSFNSPVPGQKSFLRPTILSSPLNDFDADVWVSLPSGFNFKPNILSKTSGWQTGKLEIPENNFEILYTYFGDYPKEQMKAAVWLVMRKFDKHTFAVAHILRDTGSLVLATNINQDFLTPKGFCDVSKTMNIGTGPLKGLEPFWADVPNILQKRLGELVLRTWAGYHAEKKSGLEPIPCEYISVGWDNELHLETSEKTSPVDAISIVSLDDSLYEVTPRYVPADGDCAFHALRTTRMGFVMAVATAYGNTNHSLHQQVRALFEAQTAATGVTFETWLANMRTLWAGEFELNLWGLLNNRSVMVFTRHPENGTFYNPQGYRFGAENAEEVWLAHVGATPGIAANHYIGIDNNNSARAGELLTNLEIGQIAANEQQGAQRRVMELSVHGVTCAERDAIRQRLRTLKTPGAQPAAASAASALASAAAQGLARIQDWLPLRIAFAIALSKLSPSTPKK